MKIDIITLFPGMLTGFLSESMIGKAREKGLVDIDTHNLRDWGFGKWNITDDRPFGGGAGMLLKPEPLCAAIDSVKKENSVAIYLSPDGEQFDHDLAVELSASEHLVLVSGHYEGIDQRVRDTRIDREISIGDFVLTNGTLPAAVLVDAVVRQIPGVLGAEKSLTQDSFHRNVLGFPQYRGATIRQSRGDRAVARGARP
jgi:tRNA (guanine37-N1)-methyltransferase